ncbi:MAG TPA: (Fe-S)-binding protein [Pseudomonadota bacterium]|nr:(Fe-S)-binding protein [Pseudomonadota bacterium]
MLDLTTSLEHCTFCPRLCSHACPVSLTSAREALTPQAKMSFYAARKLGEGSFAATGAVDETALPQRPLPIYACTGCGACTTACVHKVEPARALMQARSDAEAAEVGAETLIDLPERHARRVQKTGAALAAAPALAERTAQPGEVAFLPSCLARDSTAQSGTSPAEPGPVREAAAFLRISDRLRVTRPDFPATGLAALPASCAGYPLYAGGFIAPFRLYAETFAHAVQDYEVLAVSCSACTWLLRTQYADYGVPLRPRILHVSELLAPYAEALPVTRPLASVNYHDPCHLGRRLGCYEPPRQLLRRIAGRVCELPNHGEEARCCGAGGLLPLTERALAGAMARDRVGELADSDQPHAPLVSSCPGCQHHMGRSAPGVGVTDLLAILDEASR